MPVIKTLGNPGFRDRHWENVSNIVGFPVKGGSNLFQILDMGLDEYVSKFEKISDAATKESCQIDGLHELYSKYFFGTRL